VFFWAIRNGVPVDEMEERINAHLRLAAAATSRGAQIGSLCVPTST
jgi:hypothetical protein